MADYRYFKRLAEETGERYAKYAAAADDFAASFKVLRYSESELIDEKRRIEEQFEERLSQQRQAYDAAVRALEETARLELEAGVAIGEKRAIAQLSDKIARQERELANLRGKLAAAESQLSRLRVGAGFRQIASARLLARRLVPQKLRSVWRRFRVSADAKVIARSGAFDAGWYLQAYPDVAASGMDPLRHYVESGAREGRKPSATFDPVKFVASHPSLRNSAVNPLVAAIRINELPGSAAGAEVRKLSEQ